ncbi:hypothetical protein J6590_085445 [Homalodisca vitripennis]|nr:hypothetical protein J6590_085445 [Homalodisca vitripennis]
MGCYFQGVLIQAHRHDLPTNHQINQEILLVNYYIEELCARYRGAGVLDFNRIGRSAFTRHGMYLRPDSKHLLAELLVECLQGANRFIRGTPSPPPASPAEPSPTARGVSFCATALRLATAGRCWASHAALRVICRGEVWAPPKPALMARVFPMGTFQISHHVKLLLRQTTLDDLTHNLMSKKYRSEMLLAISVGFSVTSASLLTSPVKNSSLDIVPKFELRGTINFYRNSPYYYVHLYKFLQSSKWILRWLYISLKVDHICCGDFLLALMLKHNQKWPLVLWLYFERNKYPRHAGWGPLQRLTEFQPHMPALHPNCV